MYAIHMLQIWMDDIEWMIENLKNGYASYDNKD